MKRLWLLMAVLVCLAGCANTDPEQTTDSQETTLSLAEQGCYVPESEAEAQTNGALRLYRLPQGGYHSVLGIGGEVMLAAGTEELSVQVLSGDHGYLANSATLPKPSALAGGQTIYSGFAYYDEENCQAVYLDPQLQESKRVDLPADIQGSPVFSADGGEIYYCVPQQIRGLDPEKGISRLIKSHNAADQTLLGSYFDGGVILCQTTSEAGEQALLYISTADGATLSADMGIRTLATHGEDFFAYRMDGITGQYIFGPRGGELRQLNVAEDAMIPAVDIGGVVGVSQSDGVWKLSYYDLTSGQKTAAVDLPVPGTPISYFADRWTNCFWILMDDGQTLLRWAVKQSPVTEETVWAGPVFTANAPDEDGLDQLQDRVDSLNRTHGTMIRIWKTAVKTDGGHDLQPEYQTEAISQCLDRLEEALALYPENFLYKSVSSKIRICIVRSVDGQVAATRYWDEGDAFIVLSAGVDMVDELLRAMGYIVDSHILGNSPMLDAWEALNPEGFAYGGEAAQYETYLEGQDRAFVDATAMASLSEERAGLFYQAMLPENAEMFASPVMQAKLLLLCRSIRDAWRLERKTDVYTWEQYLAESIAYQPS